MLFFHLYLTRSQWNPDQEFENFYTNFDKTDLQYSKNYNNQIQPIKLASGNVYITKSIFNGCYNLDYQGGAICYENLFGQILIEFSTFKNCSTKGFVGGAIYTNGCDSVIYCVCGNNCYTSSWGQFLYTTSNKNFPEKLNYVNSSSVFCSKPINNGNAPIYLEFCKQICSSVNVSYNHVKSYSALYFDEGSYTTYIKYCSINSNIASDSYCIFLASSSYDNEYEIDTCNIINNDVRNGTSENNAVITCSKNTVIRNCCIIGNIVSDILSNKIFHADTKIGILLNDSCVEGSLQDISESNNVITDKNEFFLNNLRFTATDEYCYAGIDKVGDLTPIPDYIPTPVQTPNETPVQSPFRSPYKTPNQSPFRTPNRSPIATPYKTVPRSYKNIPLRNGFSLVGARDTIGQLRNDKYFSARGLKSIIKMLLCSACVVI